MLEFSNALNTFIKTGTININGINLDNKSFLFFNKYTSNIIVPIEIKYNCGTYLAHQLSVINNSIKNIVITSKYAFFIYF